MEQIKIGILINTHGLQGEVKIKSLTDFPELRFHKGNTILLEVNDQFIEIIIERVRNVKDQFIIKFKDYDDINMVEKWKGCALYIPKASIQPLKEDEAYYFELKDCTVEDVEGNVLGVVTEIIETSANAVLRVQQAEHQFLVPFVKAFVKAFRRDEKIIVIEVMDGLL